MAVGTPPRRLWIFAGALASGVAACAGAPADDLAGRAETVRSAVVYGDDGRRELWEVHDETLRTRAVTVDVAILEAATVRVATDGAVTLPPDSVEVLLGVCADEPFAAQPAAARCSGVLVGPSLVLTATHCLRDVPCESMAVVRGFAYDAPDELRPLRTTDVARCKRVLSSAPTRGVGGDRDLDFAWLELDGGFDGVPAARIEAESAIEVGATVVLIGHGEGVPVKIDGSGVVREQDAPLSGQMRASLDNFAGGFGGGVFDAAGRLLGIAVNGAADYELSPSGCRVARRLEESEGAEVVTLASRALAGLCDAVPSSEICASPRHSGGCTMGAGRERVDSKTDLAAITVAALSIFSCALGRIVASRRHHSVRAGGRRGSREVTV